MDIPEYAKGDHELWTPRLMRDALVHAIRTMRALPGGGFTSSSEAWADFNDDWGYADDQRNNDERVRPTAKDITRMEILLIGRGHSRALLNGAVLGYREHRRVLIKWAKWVAHGCRNEDGDIESDEQFSWRIKTTEATMKRYRDFAALVMAQQANRDGIKVWHVEKPVRRRKRRGNVHVAGSA